MPIFSDTLLNQLTSDAELAIVRDTQCLYHRFLLPVVAGTSVYTLPSKVNGVKRITYRGWKLEPVSWEELTILSPGTFFINDSNKEETSQSRPFWYALHPTNVSDIRLYPTPAETFNANDPTIDPYSPDSGPSCIVSCWRNVDTSFIDPTAVLPQYIDRRTRKAYVLWKAFEKDGPGQSLTAAKYYEARYKYLIESFRKINDGSFISKRYALDDGWLSLRGYKYPKPILPSNFERIIFR